MKKSVLYLFAIILVLSSCQNLEKTPKPEKLIPRDKMIQLLTDIAFVRSAKSSYKKVFEIEKLDPEAYILKKHKIDSVVFAENNLWYSGQLDRYEDIFNKVKVNIEEKKTIFEKLKKEEDSIKRIQDSIKRAKENLDDSEELIEDSEEVLESIKENDTINKK